MHSLVDLDLFKLTLPGFLWVHSPLPIDSRVARIQGHLLVYLAALEVPGMLRLSKNTAACLKDAAYAIHVFEEIVGPVNLRLDPSQLGGLGNFKAVPFEQASVSSSVALWIRHSLLASC